MRKIQLTLLALLLSFASFATAIITGPTSVCAGSTILLADATPGGTWSSSDPSVLTITSGGSATGLLPGVAVITYDVSGVDATLTVTVDALPAPITGSGSICVGGTTTLAGSGGGIWSSSTPGIVTIGATSGVAVGVAVGVANIQYTLGTGCYATRTVTVEPSPTAYAMTGGGSYCSGGPGVDLGLAFSTVGTSYHLYNGSTPVGSAVAGSSSAIDFGLFATPGTYSVEAISSTTGCFATMLGSETISVSPLPNPYAVTGGGSYCAGGSGVAVSLSSSSSDAGIHYQLLNGSAVVGSPVTGTGSAITFGVETAAGSYTVVATNPVTTCDNNMTGSATVIVNPLPVAYTVTGGGSYCAGGTGLHIGLDGSNSGTNYQLYNGTVAVGSAISGTGSVIDFGLETIAGTYAVVAVNTSTLCTNNMSGTGVVSIATSVTPTVAISAAPGTTVCTGTSVTYTAAGTNTGSAPTYEWAINSVTVSSAGATYTYTPVNGDMIEVFMTSSASCASPATVSTSVVATVISTAVTATATEASCGGYYTLTAGGATTYTWAPGTGLSCTACGTPTCSGLTASGAYTVTGTDTHGCTGTASVSVNFNRISGHISYFGGVSTDVFKVWLIQFDGTDSTITALDSVNSCMDAGIPYYEFSTPASGNYMVKAKLDGTVPGSSGYISTYSYSTPNWYDAATTAHTAGADTMNVSMVYGTVPTGSGFIGGYISSGAGRGTSGDVPAIGMVVYLTDASGHVITYTYTDATGSYVFPSLANGTYLIYPENYSFHTTPSATIALSPFNETVTGINFRQYNTTGRILPAGATAVPVTTAQEFNIYPNPATGDLFIQWSNKMIGDADVTITDVTGRTVLATTININAASGQSELSVAELKDGIYLISIKSEMSTFNSKVVIQN